MDDSALLVSVTGSERPASRCPMVHLFGALASVLGAVAAALGLVAALAGSAHAVSHDARPAPAPAPFVAMLP